MSRHKHFLKAILDFFGRPFQVEFDYCDRSGQHHGRCYVRTFGAGKRQVARQMKFLGYRNVRIR